MLFAILTLIVGLSISATAGYFSIVGLGQLFAASFWGVVLMGFVIESGKVVAASWLHRNWHNPLVSKLHKAYLILAIIIAMTITSLGIFSYLSKAHLDQEQPVIQQLTSQQTIESEIETLQKDMDNLQKNLDDINNLSKDKNNANLDRQRSRILWEMEKDRQKIQELNNELLKTKKETSQVTLQLGPAEYLADIIFGNGSQNVDKAVQIFIVLIMTVFDPLAIMLILSSGISFRTIALEKNKETTKITLENQEVKDEKSEKVVKNDIDTKPATKEVKKGLARLKSWIES